MGYDGIYLSRVVKPSLVTYQQNTKSLGRLAADKLIELIEHPRVTLPEQIRVSGKLLDGRLRPQPLIIGPELPGRSF